MFFGKLEIPAELQTLIDNGVWPTEDNAFKQNIEPIVSREIIKTFAPDESHLFLDPPPFRTVLRHSLKNQFWLTDAAPLEIRMRLALVIGDFGIGSDAPIILDYQVDRSNPSVKRLQWPETNSGKNHWVEIAPSFSDFVGMLGLNSTRNAG